MFKTVQSNLMPYDIEFCQDAVLTNLELDQQIVQESGMVGKVFVNRMSKRLEELHNDSLPDDNSEKHS